MLSGMEVGQLYALVGGTRRLERKWQAGWPPPQGDSGLDGLAGPAGLSHMRLEHERAHWGGPGGGRAAQACLPSP